MNENKPELITRSNAVITFTPRWELEDQIRRIWDKETTNKCIEVRQEVNDKDHRRFFLYFRASDGKITGINFYRGAPHISISTKLMAKGLPLEEAIEKLCSEIEEGYVSVSRIEL